MAPVAREKLQDLVEGRKRIIKVDIIGDDELLITMEVRGRIYTVRGQPEIGAAPTIVRPWENEDDPNWLLENYAEHGSFAAISEAFSLTDKAARTMQAYARDRLHWRIQDGNEMKRWEFIKQYFASPVPSERPNADVIAEQLRASKGNISRWKNEALAGRFFSKYFSLERLLELQNYQRTHYVYFPDTTFTPADFSLAHEDGWPMLPAGLLSELLPRLKGWKTRDVNIMSGTLRVNLLHAGEPIEFELETKPQNTAILKEASHLESIQAFEDHDGTLHLNFDTGETTGQVVHVIEARATPKFDQG